MAEREPFARLRRFIRELKRRNVYKVAATYVAVSFVGFQAMKLLVPSTTLPSWADELILAFLITGLPVAVVVAWAFELTPEGVRRTAPAGGRAAAGAGTTPDGSQPAVKALVALGVLAGAVAVGWHLMGAGGSTISDRSVAVLPFETLGDTASTSFTEGLHNDLLTRLQRVSDLTVIARPSVMRYEDTDKALARVARELDARWIVTAAVQTAGGRVQVNPRLIDPGTGAERWSESYRGELTADRVFALQEEITRSIAHALEAELGTGERKRVRGRPTEDLDAYRLYVRGRHQLARSFGLDEHLLQAVRFFRRAIERDSSFALAWTGLADAAAYYPSGVPDSVVVPSLDQESAARRALELDPDLAEAHVSMGFVHFGKQDAPAARRELRRAIDLKPSYWEAHHWLGRLYLYIGRSREAVDHLELALEINPRHARARHYLFDAYLAAGRFEQSLAEARRQQRMGLEERFAAAGEVRALYHLGRYGQALRVAEEHLARLEEGEWARVLLRTHIPPVAAARGDTARARREFERLREDVPEMTRELPQFAGLIHASLGEIDRAFAAFERLDEEDWGSISTNHILRSGALLNYARLRDDPRYGELIREGNRAWGLNPDGSFPGGGVGARSSVSDPGGGTALVLPGGASP